MTVLHESGDYLVSHEQVCSHPSKEGESSGRLGNDKEVDNGVDYTAGSKDPEDEDGSGEGGVGEDVEEPDAEEGEDVLHVVQVSSTYSFNILVHPGFEAFLLLADNILRGDEGTRSKPLSGCEEGHEEHLDDNNR